MEHTLPEKLSDPKWFGPGKWDLIHSLATDATTPEKKKNYLYFIRHLTSNLKCPECKGHAMKYVEDFPPEDFLHLRDEGGNEIGLAKWSWIFHNDVNRRLGKPEMDWITFYRIYISKEAGICLVNCGDDKNNNTSKRDIEDNRYPHSKFAIANTPRYISTYQPEKQTTQYISNNSKPKSAYKIIPKR